MQILIISRYLASFLAAKYPSFKNTIGNKNEVVITSLCIFFPKVSQYLRRFGKNKCMSFLVSNKQLHQKQNGDKISNKMEKDLIPI